MDTLSKYIILLILPFFIVFSTDARKKHRLLSKHSKWRREWYKKLLRDSLSEEEQSIHNFNEGIELFQRLEHNKIEKKRKKRRKEKREKKKEQFFHHLKINVAAYELSQNQVVKERYKQKLKENFGEKYSQFSDEIKREGLYETCRTAIVNLKNESETIN